MNETSDLDYWRRSAAGDAQAFGELYLRHARTVQAFCLLRTCDPATAEDLRSMVFLEAWKRCSTTQLTGGSVRAFLLGIAANMVRHQWRSRRRHAAALAKIYSPEQIDHHEEETVERLAAIAEVRRIHGQLRSLPKRDREVLTLFACGLSYEEIATAVSVPVGTVRSRLSRMRARLEPDSIRLNMPAGATPDAPTAQGEPA